MELRYRGTFFRDLDNIKNQYVLLAVKNKITEIKIAKSITQISRLKQFRERKRIWYKMEIRPAYGKKIYWFLCIIEKNSVELRRIKPETFFKKHF